MAPICLYTSGGLSNSPQVFFLASANSHSACFDEVLHAHVIDSFGGKNNIGSGIQNFLDSLDRDIRFPLSDLFQLIWIVNNNMNSERHTCLHQIHVQTCNLCTLDTGFHRYGTSTRCVPLLIIELTLRGHGAIQCVSFDQSTFSLTLSVSFQDIHGFNGIFDLSSAACGLYA